MRTSVPGFSLIELIVVIALIGLLAAVGSMSIPAPQPQSNDLRTVVARVRREASERGHLVRVRHPDSAGIMVEISAYPDGRIIADSSAGVDMLSGRAKPRPR